MLYFLTKMMYTLHLFQTNKILKTKQLIYWKYTWNRTCKNISPPLVVKLSVALESKVQDIMFYSQEVLKRNK